MVKPYVFQPVYAFDEAVDLGTRLVNGDIGLDEMKDACGIAGCALEKHDGDALVLAATEDLSGESIEALGQRLKAVGEEGQAAPATAEAGAIWTLLLPIILQIIRRLLDGGIFGGGNNGTTPGPV